MIDLVKYNKVAMNPEPWSSHAGCLVRTKAALYGATLHPANVAISNIAKYKLGYINQKNAWEGTLFKTASQTQNVP